MVQIPSHEEILAGIQGSAAPTPPPVLSPKAKALQVGAQAAEATAKKAASPVGLALNTVKGLFTPKPYLEVAKNIGQSMAREAGAVGQKFLNVATLGRAPAEIPAPDTTTLGGKFQKAIYGTDKPVSLQSVGEEYPFVPKGSKIAPSLALGGFALNIPFGGNEAVVKNFAKEAAKLTDKEAIGALAKKLLGVTDEQAVKFGEKYAAIPDAKVIENDLRSLRGAARVAEAPVRTAAEQAPEVPGATAREVPLPRTPENIPEVPSTVRSPVPAPSLPKADLASLKSVTPTDIESYIKSQVAEREAARVFEKPTTLAKAKSFLANAKTKLVDFAAPIEDTLKEATKRSGIKLKPSENVGNAIDRVLRAPTLAGQFAKDNGIVDIIKKVDNPDALDQYLIAKHAIELDTRGITTGRNLKNDEILVKALAPKYEEYAKVVAAYSRALLDYSVEKGLISKELAAALKKRYPDYVPFQRVFSELEKAGQFSGGKGVASLSRQTVVQAIEGSERAIESPLQSLLAKTNDAFRQGEKNEAARILASYKDLPGNPFQLKELKNGEHAPFTISFFENGVKKTFATTEDIANAAKALNVQQLNILGKIFALPTRIARVGITGINLPFVLSNIAKDQVSAFINSDKGLKTSIANPENFVRSLFSAVKHDELYNELVRQGGGGTSFDIARDQVPETFSRLRATRTLPSRILYTVTHPGELLRTIENVIARSEELTRIQQYRGTKEALLKEGMDPAEAKIAAAKAAREASVNFARRGEWGGVLNSAFLYLNASIQGTRTLLRNLKDKPVQTATKIAVSVFFPIAAATAWNMSDPKRKAAYDDIADYEKQNNLIIVPPDPKKDSNGKWNITKIPLSQEINNLAGLVRRPLEAAAGLDPLKFSDIASALVGTVSPVAPTQGAVLSTLTPQAIKPTIEAATNRNLFTGFPQVPQSLEGLSPENQVRENTSGTARKIGQLLGVSPIKAEEFIKGTFGGVGPQALHVVDTILASLGQIPKEQIGGQNVLDAITARFGKASGGRVDQRTIDEVKTILQQQADESAAVKQKAKALVDSIQGLSREEAIAKLNVATAGDKVLKEKVKEIIAAQKKGLDTSDNFILQLNVQNGARAKYIVEQVNKIPTREEKLAYLKDLEAKGVISKNVKTQIRELLQKQKAP